MIGMFNLRIKYKKGERESVYLPPKQQVIILIGMQPTLYLV
jgi:hypothetical protein